MLLDTLEIFTALLKLEIIIAAPVGTTILKTLPIFSLESCFLVFKNSPDI